MRHRITNHGNFWVDCVLGTVFIFALMGGIYKFLQLDFLDALDPIGAALSDMELTDITFSQLREDPEPDTNIVIVNIGPLGRRGIAEQLMILNKYEPKIIGFDIFFDCAGLPQDPRFCPPLADTVGNEMLSIAIAQAKNIVMVTKLAQTDSLVALNLEEEVYDSLRRSDERFRIGAYEGFANLETEAKFQDDYKVCRRMPPTRMVNGEQLYAYSVQMAYLYDSAKTERFLARNNIWETINYKGNIMDVYGRTNYPNMFFALDWDDVLNENFWPGMLKDKIVLIGSLGDNFQDTSWDDKFFTPVNKTYAGKANPDMYGIVVHANVVSMILSEDYIDEIADWQELILAIVICFLNLIFCVWVYRTYPEWYDGVTKLVQVIEVGILAFVMVMIFHLYSYKLDLTISLAAVALVGDGYEVYAGVVKNLFRKGNQFILKLRGKLPLTNKEAGV